MNLLAKRLSFKNLIKPGIILMIPVFLGCETSDDLGVKYNLDTNANVKYIEFTLPASTIYVDSLRTDNTDNILIGNYGDTELDSVVADSYVALSYTAGSLPSNLFESDFIFDSVYILLESSSGIPMNADFDQSISVYQLEEELLGGIVYLRNNQQNLSMDMLGSSTQSIRPSETDYFTIPLSASFGQALNEIGINSERLSTESWPQLGLISNASSKGINLFNLLSDTSRLYLKIYDSLRVENGDTLYKVVNGESILRDTTYLAEFSMSSINYTHIDRSKAKFKTETETVDLLNGKLMVDPLFGITTKYDFSELKSFFSDNENIIINNAAISFLIESEERRDTLENFYGFFHKENGFVGSALLNNPFSNLVMSDNAYISGQSSPAVSLLSSNKDELSMNATLFFQTLYNNFWDSEVEIAARNLTFNDSQNEPFDLSQLVNITRENITLQRAVISQDGIKLRIYYTEVN